MLVISRSNGPSKAEAKKLIFSTISENKEEIAFITDYSYNKNIYSKTDKIFTKGKDRVTFDVSKYDIYDECPYQDDVHTALYHMGFELTDYMKGLCKHEDGRVFRIAKVLKRNKDNNELVQNFINSPARASYKSKKVATLSRNMFDIITMSTFKGWSSCMDLRDGCNKEFVGNDIACGTLIIYLHDEKDVEIKSPICRILLRPFYHYAFGKLNLFYGSEAISYGTSNIDMETIGKDIANFINMEISDKRYRKIKESYIEAKIHNNVYEDDIPSTIIVEFQELDFTDIDKIRNFKIHELNCHKIKTAIETVKDKNIFIINPEFYSYVNFTIDENLKEILYKESDEIITAAFKYLAKSSDDYIKLHKLFSNNEIWNNIRYKLLLQNDIINDEIREIYKHEPDFLKIVEIRWDSADKKPFSLSKPQVEIIQKYLDEESRSYIQNSLLMLCMIKTVENGDDSILDICKYNIQFNLLHYPYFDMEEKAKLLIKMDFRVYGSRYISESCLNSNIVPESLKEIIRQHDESDSLYTDDFFDFYSGLNLV